MTPARPLIFFLALSAVGAGCFYEGWQAASHRPVTWIPDHAMIFRPGIYLTGVSLTLCDLKDMSSKKGVTYWFVRNGYPVLSTYIEEKKTAATIQGVDFSAIHCAPDNYDREY